MKKRGKLFTLIELLFVIAIISILAALLLPSLNKARNNAKKMTCLNIMKSFSAGSFMYSTDFGGWHTYAWMLNSSGLHLAWTNDLNFRTYMGLPEVSGWREYWPASLICPNATLALSTRHGDLCNVEKAIAINNTDPNSGGFYGAWASDNFAGFKLDQIKRPATSVSWCDSLAWQTTESRSNPVTYYYPDGESAISASSNPVAYRHDRGANAAFFDGHAWNMKDKDLSLNQKYWRIY